jgi:hypothetical protein
VPVEVLDAPEELFGVAQAVADEGERGVVGAARDHVVGDGPDLGEAAIREQDPALAGNHEDAVEESVGLHAEQRTLERRVEPRQPFERAPVRARLRGVLHHREW